MSQPSISIILPAYNCSQYVGLAISSLLQQTFTDFELIILNDGSTDNTAEIIDGYADKRIKYISNERNNGLVYTLKRGIALATGTYVARMDADDIALPERLALQKKWLDEHEDTDVISCTVQMIDDTTSDQGIWKEDRQTVSYKTIKNKMAWSNCIAHSSVMIRRETALLYPYNLRQLHCEDYDLWLRLLADGRKIEKLPQPLLQYRVHENSITGTILRKNNPFFKQFRCKKRFLTQRVKSGQWGVFENRVLFTTLFDGVMGLGKQVKNKLVR